MGADMSLDKWRRSRGLAAAILGFALIVAVAACGRSQAQVALPKKATHAQLVRVVPPPSTRQLVVTAYEGYWLATNQAINSHNPATAKAILADYVPASAVPDLVTGMAVLWRRGELAFGAPVFHVMSVKITGPGTAAVHDCIDLSHTGFQNRKTGQLIGGLGQSHDYLITTLALEHGRWLVTGAIPVVQACAY
jgi:hypothetical protein